MKKKYKLNKDGRIVALRDFSDVKKGDIGGFVDNEHNLSHEGDSWVYGNASVSGNAFVYENARVSGTARVSGDMQIDGIRPYLYIEASKDSITATPGLINIGCESHSPTHWLKHYKEIGKKNGYTEAQIYEYGCLLSLFKQCK